MYQWKMSSKVGNLFLVASAKGLVGVYWKRQPFPLLGKLGTGLADRFLSRACQEIGKFLEGKTTKFSVPLDIQGTDFQKTVWKKLSKIPYGKTVSYKDIAKQINKPKAVRAVGTANGRNPLCLIIPCHRVITSLGTLGGYSGGLKVKKMLLELEGSKV